jgi:hypothetical protein
VAAAAAGAVLGGRLSAAAQPGPAAGTGLRGGQRAGGQQGGVLPAAGGHGATPGERVLTCGCKIQGCSAISPRLS